MSKRITNIPKGLSKSEYCSLWNKLKKAGKLEYRELPPKRDGYYYVYYLPEEHYIGISGNLRNRFYHHDKCTFQWEIVARFEREVDAAWFETLFHQRGYNGYQNHNGPNKITK